MHLHEFQQRVVDEASALDEKILALSRFLQTKTYDSLPDAERARLAKQKNFMCLYWEILNERIDAFG